MYYYELHLHTQETSRCGASPACDMVKAYKDKGFSGVCITDHFVNGNSYSSSPSSWKEKMDAFVLGYRAAKKAGDALGIDVFFGFEYTYQARNGEDYLVLGLTEDNLYSDLIDCDTWELAHFIDTVHTLGGILIRAHPYREAAYIKQVTIRPGLNIDAIEVFNGGNLEEYNAPAVALAVSENKPMVCGSDTHHVNSTARSYIGLPEKAKDARALCRAIQNGEATLIHKPQQQK